MSACLYTHMCTYACVRVRVRVHVHVHVHVNVNMNVIFVLNVVI